MIGPAVTLTTVALSFATIAVAAPALRPNVLVILADDLAKDIGETTNIAADHPNIVKRLRGLVAGAIEDMGDDSGQHPGRNSRPPGQVENPQFIISHEGFVR